MKVSLAICAKDLPSVSNYYAVVTRDNEDLGKTDLQTDTKNPTWTNAIVVNNDEDDESPPSGSISIAIYNEGTNQTVANDTFDLTEIWNNGYNAIAKAQEKEGNEIIMAVHMEETIPTGTLQLSLRGKDLDNVDSRLGKIAIRKSDPFYEIKNTRGTTLYTSEIVPNNLNPEWKESNTIDMNELCSGDLEETIQVVVMDHDDHQDGDPIPTTTDETNPNMKLIGVVSTTVRELVESSSSSSSPSIDITKKGKVTGKVIVVSAQVDGMNKVSPKALQVLEYVSTQSLAESKAEKAVRAKDYASQLLALATAKQEEAEQAVSEFVDRQSLAEKTKEAAQELKLKSKTQRCTGTIQLKIRGHNLPDLDGLFPGKFNKSDPFFEVYGYNGDVLYKSETVNSNLNPIWEKTELDIFDLTNGNLDTKVRITVYDEDLDDKKEYIGQVLVSVNTMLESSSKDGDDETPGFNIVKGLQTEGGQGQLIVEDANLVDYVCIEKKARELKEEAEELRMSSYDMEKKSKAAAEEAQNAMVEAKKAERESMIAQDAADEVATVLTALSEDMAALSL